MLSIKERKNLAAAETSHSTEARPEHHNTDKAKEITLKITT